uniref:Uncharacterized protein n=1 Tax=Octopus bimaculoides TaxID=37653 RepID=A0A0L8I564_OCTBM
MHIYTNAQVHSHTHTLFVAMCINVKASLHCNTSINCNNCTLTPADMQLHLSSKSVSHNDIFRTMAFIVGGPAMAMGIALPPHAK